MRDSGIEIKVKKNDIPQEILDSDVLDIEFSSHRGYDIMWIHDDGFKPFTEDLFQYLAVAESAYNRKTETDHLDIFVETEDELEEFDKDIDGVKYKNIKFSELGTTDLSKVKLKRNLKEDKVE